MLHIQMDQTNFIWPVSVFPRSFLLNTTKTGYMSRLFFTHICKHHLPVLCSIKTQPSPPPPPSPLKFTEKNKTNIINSRPEAFPALAA